MVKKYSNHFKYLFKKIDLNERISITNTIKQFFNRFNPAIASLIYISGLVTL